MIPKNQNFEKFKMAVSRIFKIVLFLDSLIKSSKILPKNQVYLKNFVLILDLQNYFRKNHSEFSCCVMSHFPRLARKFQKGIKPSQIIKFIMNSAEIRFERIQLFIAQKN